MISSRTALLFLLGLSACIKPNKSKVDVTNGKVESGFPFVVGLRLDDKGSCTGSFVSETVVLTAAHCVDTVAKVSWNGVSVGRENIFFHPLWSTPPQNELSEQAKYDTALVRFPAGTYRGGSVANVFKKTPKAGDEITIVGYGFHMLEPYDKYCMIPSKPGNSGMCSVIQRTRTQGISYNDVEVFQFPAGLNSACQSAGLLPTLSARSISFNTFVAQQCNGNLSSKMYKEIDHGTKHSGTNVIREVRDGTIRFHGSLGGAATGSESASAAGDSGGPMFVKENDAYKIVGTTHGGMLGIEEGQVVKKSIYVDLSSEPVSSWLKKTVAEQKLDFPDFK